ncbi:hypothetical protein CPR19092_LGOLGGFK_02277 [Companilactobacillus paralimentarius]|jgi:ABC-2 type transporter.|uniref:ABC transporter permease n=1 Tax=Companilactobacillus paralimentarius TaxID=83526 RepID=UPI003850A41A
MKSLIERNLRLFFSSKSKVFFSLLGALISFVLYLVFLRQSMQESWSALKDSQKILDYWLIGGTLTVTTITTTGGAMTNLVSDRESNRLADLVLTDTSYTKITLSYLLSAWIIGFIMQGFMYAIMQVYFMIQDKISFDGVVFLKLLGLMILSSLLWSAINLLIFTFVKTSDTFGKINTIIGTAAGFFAGVYFPIGAMPTFAKSLIKLTPVPYNAAIYRQVMMNKELNHALKGLPVDKVLDFKKSMGIVIGKGFSTETYNMGITFIIVIVLILGLYRYNKNVVLNKV